MIFMQIPNSSFLILDFLLTLQINSRIQFVMIFQKNHAKLDFVNTLPSAYALGSGLPSLRDLSLWFADIYNKNLSIIFY